MPIDNQQKVTVLGLGYIGLPTAAVIARAGASVVGIDVTQSVVDTVNDGAKAVEKARDNDYALIIMDMQMPHLDGVDATRQIRGMERPDALSIPILAMSADAFDDDIQASLACGMNDHIAKPIHPGTLYEKLSRALR